MLLFSDVHRVDPVSFFLSGNAGKKKELTQSLFEDSMKTDPWENTMSKWGC